MASPTSNTQATTQAGSSAQEQLFNMGFAYDTLFWTGLSFALLLVVMWRFVVPAANKALDDRARHIRDDLDKAAAMRNEAQQALAAYEKQLRTSRQEAHDIVMNAKAEAEKLMAHKTAELERDLHRRKEEARKDIEQAKTRAMMDVREQVVDLALSATEKLIADTVDKKKAGELADEAIKDLTH